MRGERDVKCVQDLMPPPCHDGRMLHSVPQILIAYGSLALLTTAKGKAMSATELSQNVRSAGGGAVWDNVTGLIQDGTVVDSGMEGTWHAVIDFTGQETVESADFGRVRAAEGILGAKHWRQDFSGGAHCLDSDFAQQSTATDLWLATRGYLKPGFGRAEVGAVDDRTEDGRHFLVVVATPAGGQPVELWFAADSQLLVRAVRQMSVSTETATFADYRTEARCKVPCTMSVTSSASNQTRTVHVTRNLFGGPIDPMTFAQPAPPADWTLRGESVVVPIEFEGNVAVEAMINGKGPFAFILDTGGHNILTPATVAELGAETFGQTVSGGAGVGVVSQKYTRIQSVTIGNLALKDQPFAVIAMPWVAVDRGKRPPYAGILGLELFERFAVRLDYTNHSLTFTPLSNYHPKGSDVRVPMRFTDDMPLVHARLNNIEGDFAIDTGNGGTLVVQHVWAELHSMAAAMKQGIALVSYGMGGESRNWASRAKSFELGGTTLPRILVRYAEDKAGSFSSRTEAGNIGNTILPYFTVEFDYARSDMWLEPTSGFEPPPANRAGLGLLKVDQNTCIIAVIVPDGPAARAGLRSGDRVLKVGDEPEAALTSFELRARFTAAPGKAVPVTVLRDGRELTVSIILSELLP